MVTPMRRRVTTVMTVTTAVVVGLSLRASAQGQAGPMAVSPAGVVSAAPRNTTPSSAAPSKTPGSRRARATKAPKVPKTSLAPKPSSSPRTGATHAPSHPAPRTPTPSPASITVNGGVADTMYGAVQVQITVRGGRITSAHAIDYPQGGGRDQQINSRAIPLLDQETLQLQSAQIDTVSGATYTSDGYRRSLQSALDAAHRAA
jgi:uncharacterized protein with FMN-binding domain